MHATGTSYCTGCPNSTGSERAIEIYNPTNSTVSLTPYSVRRYSNGNSNFTEEERLLRSNASQQPVGVNSITPHTAFVLASGEATLSASASGPTSLAWATRRSPLGAP